MVIRIMNLIEHAGRQTSKDSKANTPGLWPEEKERRGVLKSAIKIVFEPEPATICMERKYLTTRLTVSLF